MNNEASFLHSPQRWNILTEITEGIDSATTIAEKLELSIPYINTQLKLLEAAGYLKKEKKRSTKIGKPRTHYKVTKELAVIAAIKPNKTRMMILKPQKHNIFMFNTLFLKNEEELYYLQKFYYTNEELIHSTEMMALIDTKEDGVHFFVITPNVDEFRKKYSHITITHPLKKEQKIVMWSHTKEEVLQGLKNKEEYYVEKIKKATSYWEKVVSLEELKKALEEEP